MNYVFADPEVQKLAEKPFNFVNWRDFAIALKKTTADLPACYDVPQFEHSDRFLVDFNSELVRRLGIKHGSLSWAMESVVRVANSLGMVAQLSVYDMVQSYPEMILAVTPKNK